MHHARRLAIWSVVPVALVAMAWVWALQGRLVGQMRTGEPGQACKEVGAPPPRSYQAYFGRQQSVAAESGRWRVRLVDWQPAKWPPSRFTFQAENRQTRTVSSFTVPTGTVPFQPLQVDELDVVADDRLLMLGRVGASFSVAGLAQLPSGKVLDSFPCFMPEISPDRRFLGFIKSFPGHPGPVAVSDEYLIYDLEEGAAYNRPHPSSGVRYDAGWPVYPPGATNAASENLVPGLDSPAHTLASRGLFWVGETMLAFVDFFPGQSTLVTVNLDRGVRAPETDTQLLDASQVLELSQCQGSTAPSDFARWSQDPALLMKVDNIVRAPLNANELCLRFVSNPCLRMQVLAIPVPRHHASETRPPQRAAGQ